jgi:hypothetical protein
LLIALFSLQSSKGHPFARSAASSAPACAFPPVT